jgi:rhamnosyltransferase
VAPLLEDAAIAISYSRQLPRPGADVFEAFPREFNYGSTPQVRGIEDVHQYGVYTFFCSNSCAAYKNEALDEIGGFDPILTNEDYFAVAKMLQKGYRIYYASESKVLHSHKYTLLEEFQRYFDTGYVRAQRPFVQEIVGAAERRGVGFVAALIKRLAKESVWKIPYAVAQSGVKWCGYRVGFHAKRLPVSWRKKLSQQKYFWDSKYAKDEFPS